MSAFGLHRFVIYGVRPFQYLGSLQLNVHADVASVMLGVEAHLCYPLGASASFCGWGRADSILYLRCNDVSINYVPVVLLISLDTSLQMSDCVNPLSGWLL